jgi:hypothetical protein
VQSFTAKHQAGATASRAGSDRNALRWIKGHADTYQSWLKEARAAAK